MTDKTAREAMIELGPQIDPTREALRRMISEFGDQHYHTCPADNDSGPCDCFAGHLIKDVMAVLSDPLAYDEAKTTA